MIANRRGMADPPRQRAPSAGHNDCAYALRVQRLDRRFRVGRHDFQQRACRTGWPRSVLLPVLQRAQVDANQPGELRLTDFRGLADGANVGLGEFRRACPAHGPASHMALHLAYTFDQLIEMSLIHRRSRIHFETPRTESVRQRPWGILYVFRVYATSVALLSAIVLDPEYRIRNAPSGRGPVGQPTATFGTLHHRAIDSFRSESVLGNAARGIR